MSQIEKALTQLIGKKVKEVAKADSGERQFLIVAENRVMTHSALSARFSL